MTRNTIGIAFIGAGTVAEMHGRGIAACSNARLVGTYDLDRQKAETITTKFGGRVFDTPQQLLAEPGVDAVHVLTPVHQHVSNAVESLKAGKHVLLEKPVAETLEDIALLKAAAEQANRVCMPAHNYIYVPSIRRAKRLLQEGRLGDIGSLWILYNIFHSEQTAATYGGVLRAVCNHHAYSVLYLLGRPRRVMAMTSRVHYKKLTCEDQAMIVCEMENGSMANLWCSFATDDPTSDPWTVLYKILGTNGGISYSWNEAQFRDEGGPAWGMPCYEEGFVEEIEYFSNRCVLGGEQPLSTLVDAADALKILMAAERCISKPETLEKVDFE
ncbi:MAG: Gfo/Idh/MocA family oxidoreductase [Acidobacteriaceae bacterium]